MSLANEIQLFMVSNSDLYAGLDQVQLQWVISDGVKLGQYLYEPGEHALMYWFINDADLDQVINKNIPQDRTSGNILYIAEFVCNKRQNMKQICKSLRRLSFNGVFWHRENEPMIFPRQKGASI